MQKVMIRIFTLLVLLLTGINSFAQFSEPQLVKATSVRMDGETEYILSVTNSEGETYFYGKGNNWGTRTSAKEDVSEALTVRFIPITQTVDGQEVQCITFNNYVSDKGGWGAKVDVDDGDHMQPNNGNQSWVDGQGRRGDGFWQLTDKGNGQIELNNILVPGSKFGITKSLAVWSADEGEYVLSISDEGGDWDNRLYHIGAAIPMIPVINEDGEETGDSIPAYTWGDENYTTWQLWDASLYNLKKQISTWYWVEGGVSYADNANVAAAVEACNKVYDDPNCTIEALQAAYDEVLAAIGNIKIDENRNMLEGASPENPIDLAEIGLLVNPDFADGTWDGWNIVLTGTNNQVQSDSYSKNGVTIQNFLETWTGFSPVNGEGHATQKIDLPAGRYILGADIIATRQTGTKDDSYGVELFAKSSNGQEFSIPVATGNNAPEHFELPFQAQDDTFTIGVRYANTSCNWIAMDNFSLVYFGNTDMPLEQINLGKTIATITERHDVHDEIVAHKDIIAAYDAAYDAAVAAFENGGLEDVAQYTALADALTERYDDLTSSMSDYRYFAQCIETVQNRIAEWEDKNAACAAELADYYNAISEHYNAMDWTRAEMNEILPTVSYIMGKYTDIKPGDDVTFYLNNAKFTKDFSGWNIEGTSPGWAANHGQGENQNAELSQEVPEEEDGLAECYHNYFDMSQTIKNLPAGLYTLSAQGFNRHDDGNNESAVLYAKFSDGSEQTQELADIYDYATENMLYYNGDWSSDAEFNGLYVPNGMTGAAWHFVNKKDGKNYDYTNKLSILMREAGDLTIGIRVDNTHQWVIWDNFKLIYEGAGSNPWRTTLEGEITKIEDKCANSSITSGQRTVINAVIDEANTLITNIGNASVEDCQAMQTKLQAQYASINENLALVEEVVTYYNEMSNLWDLAGKADAELQARFEAAYFVLAGYNELDNEGLKNAIKEAKTVIALVKIPKGWEDASDDNPVDFSALIANRFFNVDGSEDPEYEPTPVANHNFTEWQGKQPSTGGGTPGNCGEVWNSDAFNMYQEITGLPEGTYVLSCQGFFRHGRGIADPYAILNGEKEATVFAYLYGSSSVSYYSTELQNIASVQLTEEQLDEQGIDITPGNSTFGKIYKGAEQLATADNFFKAGYYHNSLTVKVGADGVLRIGVEKVGAIYQDWVVVDNFSLIYYGSGSGEPTVKYTVNVQSADSQMGTVSGGGEFIKGTSATVSASPKTGYSFERWSDDSTENPYTFEVNSNTSLTAYFVPNTYTLTFLNWDGTVILQKDVKYGEAINAPDDPTRSGYTFTGWSASVPATMPAGDLTFIAQYEEIARYTVTINSNNTDMGTVTGDAGTYEVGTMITVSATANTGYQFVSWSNGVTDNPYTFELQGNVSLTAQFEAMTYTLTFKDWDGTVILQKDVKYGEAISAPADPVRPEYTFNGWSSTVPATMPARNLTFTARYTKNSYDFVEGGIYYNILSETDHTCRTTYKNSQYNSYSGTVNIPAVVKHDNVDYQVTEVGPYTFNKCSELESVSIPESVTAIQTNAFKDCSNLTKLTCKSIYPVATKTSAFGTTNAANGTLYVPEWAIEDYKNDAEWGVWSKVNAISGYKDLPLVDGMPYNKYTNYSSTSLSLTRTLEKTDSWEAFSAPMVFDVASNSNKFDLGEIYAIAPCADTNSDGEINEKDDKCLIVRKMTSGTTKPNNPYLIRSKVDESVRIASKDNVFYGNKARALTISLVSEIYTFNDVRTAGTLSNTNQYAVNEAYLMNSKAFAENVASNRWTMTVTKADGSALTIAKDKMSIYTLNENVVERYAKGERIFILLDDPTGMEYLRQIMSDDNIYTLDGRIVEQHQNLPAGIYIKNGKKVIVK